MKKIYKIISIAGLIILLGIGIGIYIHQSKQNVNKEEKLTLINQVNYLCKDNKTIEASFYEGPIILVKPGEQPIPSGKVKISLSDGRNLTLSQTLSADGARYANSDESFVFWSKGNSVLVLENNEEKDYRNCIALAKDLSGDLSNAYLDIERGFTIRYPNNYSVLADYKYIGLSPNEKSVEGTRSEKHLISAYPINKEISGIKFVLSDSMVTGTNLSNYDTGVSIEILPASNVSNDCNANLFEGVNLKAQNVTDAGEQYSFISRTVAVSGNFYEEQIWALKKPNYCLAIRYLIHSLNIADYPTGTVKEFNRSALLEQFDKIRHSLITL